MGNDNSHCYVLESTCPPPLLCAYALPTPTNTTYATYATYAPTMTPPICSPEN